MTTKVRSIGGALALLAQCLISVEALANEFPSSQYYGIGFFVEKNGDVIFSNKDLFSHDANLRISKISPNKYKWTLNVRIQKKADSVPSKLTREDRFRVVWTGKNTGELINLNSKHRDDKSHFKISPDGLIITSWIARNKVWETHVYGERPNLAKPK